MASVHLSDNEQSQRDYSERSELVNVHDNRGEVSKRSPRELAEFRDSKTLERHNADEEGGNKSETSVPLFYVDTVMIKTHYEAFKRKRVCCCSAPLCALLVGLVLASMVIGLSVSAVNHTGVFAPRDAGEEPISPYCKYYAKYDSPTQLWNIKYVNQGNVSVWDPTTNSTILQTKRGVFVEFTQKNGTKVRERFHLKGVSWSGFETTLNMFGGLFNQTPDAVFEFLANNGFNAIRIPFHLQTTYGSVKPSNRNLYPAVNSRLAADYSINSIETMVMIAAQKGMLVILDLHSNGPNTGSKDGVWENVWTGGTVTEWNVTQAWIGLANRFKKYWNVLGADIRNEMWNGTWGGWDYLHDIKGAQERIGQAILNTVPGWVVFVQGTMKDPVSVTETFAGENLIGAQQYPINFTTDETASERFFYTPHVYGPDMADFGYFKRDNFSDYLPAIWRAHWGYLHEGEQGTIMLGQWGTQVSEDGDKQAAYDSWSQALVQYLGDIDARDAFYWAVNPGISGVAGLLQDDWVTPNANPLAWAAALQPHPSKLTYYQRKGLFCLVP